MSILRSFIISLITGFIVTIASIRNISDVYLSVAYGIMSFLAAENITLFFVQKAQHDEILKKIDDRLKSMIKHAALFTKSGELDGALGLLSEVRGNSIWILAKIISEKLSKEFKGGKDVELLNVAGSYYSEFAKTIYKECERSIYLTWPDTPKAWFNDSIKKEIVSDKIFKDSPSQLDETEYPPHLIALKSCNVDKKRVVIIPDEKWSSFLTESCIRKEFERLSNWAGINLRYIKEKDFKIHFPAFKKYNLDKIDIAYFDEIIQLIWTFEGDNENGKVGTLSLRVNPEHDMLKIFKFKEHEEIYLTSSEVDRMAKKCLENEKNKE